MIIQQKNQKVHLYNFDKIKSLCNKIRIIFHQIALISRAILPQLATFARDQRSKSSNHHCNPVTSTKLRYENNETDSLHSLLKFTHVLSVMCVCVYVDILPMYAVSYIRVWYLYGGELEVLLEEEESLCFEQIEILKRWKVLLYSSSCAAQCNAWNFHERYDIPAVIYYQLLYK